MMSPRFLILLVIVLFKTLPIHAVEKRVVVITGASRGVGLATAEYLADNGFTVYGMIRPFSNFSQPIKNNLSFIHVDLLDETSIQAAVQAILEKEGHIDVLINNAGYAIVGPVESFTHQEMHDQMEVNFFAPIKFIQAVLPAMRKQLSGHIINISSTNAIKTPPFGSLYAASKAALESLSESLCIEVRPYNIAVSIIEPGLLKTYFTILMGTRDIPHNPYHEVIENIKTQLEGRNAHPELLTPSQSPNDIAKFIFNVIQDPHPKLRYQTSDEAKAEVSKKLIDLTGELFLEESG